MRNTSSSSVRRKKKITSFISLASEDIPTTLRNSLSSLCGFSVAVQASLHVFNEDLWMASNTGMIRTQYVIVKSLINDTSILLPKTREYSIAPIYLYVLKETRTILMVPSSFDSWIRTTRTPDEEYNDSKRKVSSAS